MTVILATAVILLSLAISGCVTPRHIDELNARLDRIEGQTGETRRMVANSDSLMQASEDGNTALRNELRTTVDALQQQMSALLENYNDLMQRIEEINQQGTTIRTITSSPGAQASTDYVTPPGDSGSSDLLPTSSAIDCDSTYDDTFILLMRGEYETAIKGFRVFLDNCTGHESEENAYYWIGECYYSLEKYAEAVTELEQLLENFKSSSNLGRALYKLGRSKEELDKKDEARVVFQRLVDEYSGTLEAEQAKERLEDL